MKSERKYELHGHKVEEFHWAGRLIVYIDCFLTELPFEAACKKLQQDFGTKPADNSPS